MSATIHLTVATIVKRNNHFLMVRETIDGKSVINQPAGHVEPGENIIDAAIRETLEETAWQVKLTSFLGIYTYKPGHRDATYYRLCFIAEALNFDSESVLDPDIDEALWMTAEEIRHCEHELRSPLVIKCIDDFLSGESYPLDLFRNKLY
jgi:8-oxo-dGTP pyrophosphatase MutT (NUDIX family)